MERAGHDDPRRFLTLGKKPVYEPLLYCGFCNQYTVHHEHECDSPKDSYDGYPSDTPSIDWRVASLGYYWLEATTIATIDNAKLIPLFVWSAQ